MAPVRTPLGEKILEFRAACIGRKGLDLDLYIHFFPVAASILAGRSCFANSCRCFEVGQSIKLWHPVNLPASGQEIPAASLCDGLFSLMIFGIL
jgi:hypothetical protein